MSGPNLARLAKAHRALWDARDAFDEVAVECLPVGAVVEYQHGNHWRTVTVVEHKAGSRMLVEGQDGRRYRIHPSRFVP